MPLFPRFSLGMEMDSLFKLVEMKKGLRRTRLTQYVVHPLLPVWQEERTAVDREELIRIGFGMPFWVDVSEPDGFISLSAAGHVITGVWNIPEMRPSRVRRWIEKKVFRSGISPMTILTSIISRSAMSGRKGITKQWWWRSPRVPMWSRWWS